MRNCEEAINGAPTKREKNRCAWSDNCVRSNPRSAWETRERDAKQAAEEI